MIILFSDLFLARMVYLLTVSAVFSIFAGILMYLHGDL